MHSSPRSIATFLGLALLAALAPTTGWAFVAPWPPVYVSTIGPLYDLQGVAADPSGNLFVVDRYTGQILRYDPLGSFVTSWPANSPVGVATDAAGNVYFSSSDVFAPFTFKCTNSGLSLGFFTPGNSGIAVDAAGNVFTSLSTSNAVLKTNSAGTLLTSWGGFSSPRGLAVDAAGFVYVADIGNHRVQKFSNDGTFVTQWGTFGSGNGQFSSPGDVAIDAVGNVYVVEYGNHRVQKFTKDGVYLGQWGTYGFGANEFSGPGDLDVTAGGDIYVSDHNNVRVQRFAGSGQPATLPLAATYVTQFAISHSGPPGPTGPTGVGQRGYGSVFLVSAGDSWGLGNTQTGAPITWHTPGGGVLPGTIRMTQSAYPNQAVYYADRAPGGFIHVTDQLGASDQIFAPSTPFALAERYFDNLGNPIPGRLYSLDTTTDVVTGYPIGGLFNVTFGGPGSGDGQFNSPTAITCSGDFIYVLDSGNLRVQKFQFPNTYVSQAANPLMTGSALAVDGSGNYLVYNDSAKEVRMFSPSGIHLGSWGSAGSGNGQFTGMTDMCLGDSGYVFVSDRTNGNVQKFLLSAPPRILLVSDVPGDQGGSVQVRFRNTSADVPGSAMPITSYRIERNVDGTGTWVQVGSVPATNATEYVVTVPTPATANPTTANYFGFRVRALTADPLVTFVSPTAYGASVDNLAPPPPTALVSQISGGTVYFEWHATPVADLAGYRLYKGATSAFFPLPANLVGTPGTTTFQCAGTLSDFFKLTAVDVNGNESTPVTNVAGTVGVTSSGAPRFALDLAGANPARAGAITVELALADARPARLEVCDVTGRVVRTRAVEGSGPGAHVFDVTGTERLAPGLYFVRLTQGENHRAIRVTVLD